jgi:hypothetical protein
VYLGLYQVGISFFPDSYLLSNEFQVNFTSNFVFSIITLVLLILLACETFKSGINFASYTVFDQRLN